MTFNLIANGDPAVAETVMQNWRHVNYGTDLLPVTSSGLGLNNTINLGSTTYRWANTYSVLGNFSGQVTAAGLVVNTTDLVVDTVNNRVGIGTSSPESKLHLSWGNDQLKFIGVSSGIKRIGASYTGYVSNNDYSAIEFAQAGASGGDIRFYTMLSSGSLSEKTRISEAGFFGIGTSSPSQLLHVEGATPTAYINSTSGVVRLLLNSPTGSDTKIALTENSTAQWALGHDSSDAGAFVLCVGGTIGTENAFRISQTKAARFYDDVDVDGDLNVDGNVTVSGVYDFAGGLSTGGNFSVNTNKFTVTASNGNTLVAGTLNATGNFAINTNKFNVTASSGDTSIAGNLSVTGSITASNGSLTVSGGGGNPTLFVGATTQFRNLGSYSADLNSSIALYNTNMTELTGYVLDVVARRNVGAGGAADTYEIKLAQNFDGSGTIVRANYFQILNTQIITGTPTITDAPLFAFDAAVSTHKCLASGTTKGTPSIVDGWLKMNVTGTLYYVPMYLSKTA